MGNSESKGESKDQKSPHATPTRSHAPHREKERHAHPHDGQSHPSRRQAPPPNPTPLSSLTPTSTLGTHANLAASPSISTSEIHGHGATAGHSRQRSITAGNNSRRKPDDIASSQKSDGSSTTMGQEQSKRAPSRAATHPQPTPAEKERPLPSPEPVQVPQSTHHEDFAEQEHLTPPGESSSPYGLPPSQFDRPPRLPLPIDRNPEPESPIISPTDISSPDAGSEGDGLRRRHSMLSSTTLDDDEDLDAATFNMDHDPSQPKQPTTILWRQPAHQVYITGSFVEWQKKLRMQKDPQTGQHTITLHLPPGTVYMTFLADGEMRPSTEYPTTVDFTNALMNYIEVTPQPPAPATPMPIPGAGATQTTERTGASVETSTVKQAPETGDELSATLQDTLVPGPSAAPPDQPSSATDPAPSQDAQQQQDQPPSKPPKKQLPRPKYTRDIPEMLLHLDLYNHPEDERYQRASKAMQNLPTPPTLPTFMQKSILNATTPHKDDASVLTMPNHTILNHLATSSIRSGVLATSGTTRYKRKVSRCIKCFL